jgi:prepilin-type N-terminal cleavage/methylation domain-containing protein
MRRDGGFSLIELLVVVAIILIIAAIALPNLLRARIATNEVSAAASLRTIATAELAYSLTYSTGFADLPNLGGPAPCTPSAATACIVDSLLSAGNKSGYTFTGVASTPVGGAMTEYSLTAVPQFLNLTGVKGYCATEDHVIRAIMPANGPANRATCLGGTYTPIPQ